MKREVFSVENGKIKHKNQLVLDGLYIQIYQQEIAGIICDSMLEKKCLLEFFRGNVELTEGRVYIDEKKKTFGDATKSIRKGIAIIEKTSKLISSLDVLENICLFADQRSVIFVNHYYKDILQIAQQFEITIRFEIDIDKLTPYDKVMIELVKAFVEEKKVVVLADLTGFLNKNELEKISDLIKKMQEREMSFIVMEAFEDIVFEWTQRIFVLQHGKTVEALTSKNINRHTLYDSLMLDKKIKNDLHDGRLVLSNISKEGEEKNVIEFYDVSTNYLKNINFLLESGEVLKIFYLDDESREHIVNVLSGNQKIKTGKILLNNKHYRVKSMAQAIKQGVCFLEESPYDRTLIYDMTVKDNVSLVLAKKSSLVWLNRRYSKSVDLMINEYFHDMIANVKLRKLSPEILQKLAHFKWLLYNPKVIVCIKPFAEVDIHIQEITIDMIEAFRKQGIAVIILTANFSEMNRVEGESIYIKNGEHIDENEVYQILYGNGDDR
ncbi:MAG: hypothetical protein ACERKN_11455 [Velocimicrobium sp.]